MRANAVPPSKHHDMGIVIFQHHKGRLLQSHSSLLSVCTNKINSNINKVFIPLPGWCRRSRSRPVIGSCREPPGPRSGCWGCETGAFSLLARCRFQLLMSVAPSAKQMQKTCKKHTEGVTLYARHNMCPSGLVTP